MKICLCCGAQCVNDDAPHCSACGEASFGPSVAQDPVKWSGDPLPIGGSVIPGPDAVADIAPPKRGPGRPRKDQGPN